MSTYADTHTHTNKTHNSIDGSRSIVDFPSLDIISALYLDRRNDAANAQPLTQKQNDHVQTYNNCTRTHKPLKSTFGVDGCEQTPSLNSLGSLHLPFFDNDQKVLNVVDCGDESSPENSTVDTQHTSRNRNFSWSNTRTVSNLLEDSYLLNLLDLEHRRLSLDSANSHTGNATHRDKHGPALVQIDNFSTTKDLDFFQQQADPLANEEKEWMIAADILRQIDPENYKMQLYELSAKLEASKKTHSNFIDELRPRDCNLKLDVSKEVSDGSRLNIQPSTHQHPTRNINNTNHYAQGLGNTNSVFYTQNGDRNYLNHLASQSDLNANVVQEDAENATPVVTRAPGVFYKTKICPWYEKGKCTYWDKCCFAHSVNELRSPPNLYKIRMCPNVIKTNKCRRGSQCRYAHNLSELQRRPLYKTQLCRHHQEGICAAGYLCRYAHDDDEIRSRHFIIGN